MISFVDLVHGPVEHSQVPEHYNVFVERGGLELVGVGRYVHAEAVNEPCVYREATLAFGYIS